MEAGFGLVRNVEYVGNQPVDMGGGGDTAALDVAYGGREDGAVEVILADSAVEERHMEDVEEEYVAEGAVLADRVLVVEEAVGEVAEVAADAAEEEETAGLDVVVMEVEFVVIEEATLVIVCVCVWATDTEVGAVVIFVVVGAPTGTTEISVSVTVLVASVGVAVTVSIIVVVVVVVGSVDDEEGVGAGVEVPPPSMGTTEYVTRGRKAWNLPGWPPSSVSGRQSTGLYTAERIMARSGTGKLSRRILRRFETLSIVTAKVNLTRGMQRAAEWRNGEQQHKDKPEGRSSPYLAWIDHACMICGYLGIA